MQQPNSPRRRSRDTLPKPRKNLTFIISVFTYIILLPVISARFRSDKELFLQNLLMNITIPALLIFFEQILNRIQLFPEESRHIQTRYANSIPSLLAQVFHFSTLNTAIFFTSSLTLTSMYLSNPNLFTYSDLHYFSYFIFYILLKNILHVDRGPPYDSIEIAKMNGLDYGSGMAHSFFHGYLKLVIPKTGTADKHLNELMEDYESKHGVSFDCYKLVILIPKSLYCPITLKSDGIEEADSLEEKQITVAGVQKRSYKNSVYKFLDENNKKKHYVVAEYATPLKTFRDVVASNGVHSDYYKKYQNEITLQFFTTLKKILHETESCRDNCELIYFDDKDERGMLRAIRPIILKRLRKLDRSRQ